MQRMHRQILRLAIPNIISNLTIPLLGMVDLIILGHLDNVSQSSELYIGAVALAGVIFNFIYAILSFLRMGTSGFTAQAYGRKDQQEQLHMLYRALLLSIFAGIFLIVLKNPIDFISFNLLGGSQEVRLLAKEYFHIRILAAPASLGILAFSGWFIGMQNARIPMYIGILINLLNIAANLFFVYGLGMTSDGLALGTVIAQYTGFIIAILFFLKKYKAITIYYNQSKLIDLKKLKHFFKVNTDIMIRSVSLIFAFSFFTSKSAVFGDDILAANSILLQFLMIFAYFTDGFAHAAEALTGKFLGSLNKQLLMHAVKKLFLWGIIASIPFSLIYLFFGNHLLYILTDKNNIIENAMPYLIWVGIIPLSSFAAFIWDGIYIGATASSAMRNSLLISTFIIFLPLYFLLNNPLGNNGLWIAMNGFMLSRGILLSLNAKKSIFSRL